MHLKLDMRIRIRPLQRIQQKENSREGPQTLTRTLDIRNGRRGTKVNSPNDEGIVIDARGDVATSQIAAIGRSPTS
jgi:hypothetical protein